MKYKNKTCKVLSLLLVSGMLVSVPGIRSEAAVITSNATDKIAVVFNEHTAYSAGDYVIYDGEMYICTQDIQGAWTTAEPSFMQITKNHDLGSAQELAAEYEVSADPSDEKSLMAFVANAWQKLKLFFGLDDQQSMTDAGHYKSASVSAKLNYLEEQNQSLHQNMTTIQSGVDSTFQRVSNGKSLIAGAITDKGGTANARYSFEQFGQAIKDLAQLQYNNGYSAGDRDGYARGDGDGYRRGDTDGYNRGKEEGYQQGQGEGYNTGYQQGQGEGYNTGYQEGITFADGRVNEESESYKKGKEASSTNVWSIRIHVDANGPDKEGECFTKSDGSTGNHVNWMYLKKFPGHRILAVQVQERYFSPYGSSLMKTLLVDVNGHFESLSEGGTRLGISSDSFSWGKISFNLSDTGVYADLDITVLYN